MVGWSRLWRKDRRLTALLASNFALQLYVVASWSAWSAAAAFGQRFFTNVMLAFALGLAALLAFIQKRVPLGWLVAGCAFFIIWNGLLIIRYVLEDVPRMGPVPLDDLLLGQFTVVPRYFKRIIEILLKRS